jgi:hypothetical protein
MVSNQGSQVKLSQMARRVLLSLLLGSIAAVVHVVLVQSAGDLDWPLTAARLLAQGEDPYSYRPTMSTTGEPGPVNPLTTALIISPLALLPNAFAGALFVGLSTGVLVYGLLQPAFGQVFPYWRLLLCASTAYLSAWYYVQWSMVIGAALLLPWLLPVVLAKPHIGMPVALGVWRWSRWTLLVAVGITGLSLLIFPTWPLAFLNNISNYSGRIPIATLPWGPLLLVLLWQWRSPTARLLLLMACVPQRLFYDLLMPALLTRSPFSLALVVCGSWLMVLLPGSPWFWVVPLIYAPVAGEIVLQARREQTERRLSSKR